MDLKKEADKMHLLWASGISSCFMVMITLEEKGLSGYGQKQISLDDKEQKGEVMKINPRGEVPAFKHGENIINEPFGICNYLEEIFKEHGTKLIPDEPAMKAKVLQRMYETQSLDWIALNDVMCYQMAIDCDLSVLWENCIRLREELKLWEAYLSSPYLAGDHFTMADVVFFPMLAFMIQGSLSLDDLPNTERYYDQLSKRPSIKTSWPPNFLSSSPLGIFAQV